MLPVPALSCARAAVGDGLDLPRGAAARRNASKAILRWKIGLLRVKVSKEGECSLLEWGV